MSYTPVVIFAYNRPEKIRNCLEALTRCPEIAHTPVTIYIDGARTSDDVQLVLEVQRVVEEFSVAVQLTVVRRPKNLGLATSILSGVTEMLSTSESVIVLEDDLVVSPYFLRYMNTALEIYRRDSSVASISGYWYPVRNAKSLTPTFFLRGADCWGWGTWADRWEKFEADARLLLDAISSSPDKELFDFGGSLAASELLKRQVEGQIDSWHIRWYAITFLEGLVSLYPRTSLVNNTGGDGFGTHGPSGIPESRVAGKAVEVVQMAAVESQEARRALQRFFHRLNHQKSKGRLILELISRRVRTLIRPLFIP